MDKPKQIIIDVDRIMSVNCDPVFIGTDGRGHAIYGTGDVVTLVIRRDPNTHAWCESRLFDGTQ